MSTAVGHGLADPKSRGKPVSHANEGKRPFSSRGRGFGGQLSGLCLWGGEGKTYANPVSKGIPVNIPEPEGWTECYSRGSLGWLDCLGNWVVRLI
jgi:hypothetical protein